MDLWPNVRHLLLSTRAIESTGLINRAGFRECLLLADSGSITVAPLESASGSLPSQMTVSLSGSSGRQRDI